MIKTILQIRVKQFKRILEELGLIHLIILVIVSLPFLLQAWTHIEKGDDWWLAMITVLIVTSLHLRRKDKEFLKLVTGNVQPVFVAEYFLIALPAILWSIFLGALWLVLALLIFIYGLTLVNLTIAWKQNEQPAFRFPVHFVEEVEWISGVRKNFIYLVICYTVGLIFCWWSPAIILIVLFILGAIVASFFMEAEPDILLSLYSTNSKNFIHKKIYRTLTLFWCYAIPLVFLFFILHYEYWYLFIIIVIVVSLFSIMGIVLKYATYAPNASMKKNEVILGLMISFLSLPFGQPVPLLLTIRYYNKALRNLKHYFDD